MASLISGETLRVLLVSIQEEARDELTEALSGRIDETTPYRATCLYSIGKIASLELIHSSPFRAVFGSQFDQLVFEFTTPVDVADWVDRIEEQALPGVTVSIASDSSTATIALAGFQGKVSLTRDAVTIDGRTGDPASLLEQFLVFLRKCRSIGEAPMLPPA